MVDFSKLIGKKVILVARDVSTAEVPTEDECCAHSIANWATLPEATRRKCLDHLRQTLVSLGHADFIARWGRQVARGENVGSDMSGSFHFGPGMGIRNILRQVCTDDKLPPVKQPFGEMSSNWDDYYYGALDALAREDAQ